MNTIIDIIGKIKSTIPTVSTYLSKSDAAFLVLELMVLVLLLNCVKAIVLSEQLRKLKKNKQCEYLEQMPYGQNCSNSVHRIAFVEKHNSCEKCRGKSISINKDDLERQAANSGVCKKIIISLANVGKAILPYMSILFTLVTAALFAQSNGS